MKNITLVHDFFLELLIGAKCDENQDCIERARCNKYCSCRETDLFFETEDFFCGNLKSWFVRV